MDIESNPLLRAYDEQLREAPEMAGADRVERDGPLWLGWFEDGSRGFVSYRDLDGLAGAPLAALADRAVGRFREDSRVQHLEWKTRGHDAPDELPDVLVAAGLAAEEVETVMIGEAAGVAAAGPDALPDGVELRRVSDADAAAWITHAARMQHRVFGGGPSPEQVLARHLSSGDRSEFWVAHTGEEVVCAGRLEIVPGTEFAGLWGGATHEEWRGQGIYRALAAARARSAVERGVRYLHSDCTPMSRPILARAGLEPVTTTTPYTWVRTKQSEQAEQPVQAGRAG